MYWRFRPFVRLLLFRTISDLTVMVDRERVGQEASQSAGVIDSWSVKAPMGLRARLFPGQERGEAQAAHRLRIRRAAPDCQPDDSADAQAILDVIGKRWPWLRQLFADGACDRRQLLDKAPYLDFVIDEARRLDAKQGFNALRQRWVVEPSVA